MNDFNNSFGLSRAEIVTAYQRGQGGAAITYAYQHGLEGSAAVTSLRQRGLLDNGNLHNAQLGRPININTLGHRWDGPGG